MKNDNKNMENDKIAAIGIGAMIVFIALILVAAVAAAVIIQTAEKLQQNAQSTGDDTTDEMSGKIQILNVFVDDPSESVVMYFRLAAGSDDTAAADILWQVFCEDPDGGGAGPPAIATTDRLAGNLTEDTNAPATPETWESYVYALDDDQANPTRQETVEAGISYRASLDLDDGGTNDCAPDHLFSENVKGTLYVHVVGGGTTYDILKVNDDSRGAVVV